MPSNKADTLLLNKVMTSHDMISYLEGMGYKKYEDTNGRVKFCCPLHKEEDPSFYIYPPDDEDPYQSYHCYGCKAHGKMLSLKMKLENKTARQAISELSDGMKIDTDDQIQYILDKEKSEYEMPAETDLDHACMFISLCVYQHLATMNFDADEQKGCERMLEMVDEAFEQNDQERLLEMVELIPEVLGDRARKYAEELEQENSSAAQVYANI